MVYNVKTTTTTTTTTNPGTQGRHGPVFCLSPAFNRKFDIKKKKKRNRRILNSASSYQRKRPWPCLYTALVVFYLDLWKTRQDRLRLDMYIIYLRGQHSVVMVEKHLHAPQKTRYDTRLLLCTYGSTFNRAPNSLCASTQSAGSPRGPQLFLICSLNRQPTDNPFLSWGYEVY